MLFQFHPSPPQDAPGSGRFINIIGIIIFLIRLLLSFLINNDSVDIKILRIKEETGKSCLKIFLHQRVLNILQLKKTQANRQNTNKLRKHMTKHVLDTIAIQSTEKPCKTHNTAALLKIMMFNVGELKVMVTWDKLVL